MSPCLRQSRNQHSGFTLLELIVVLAIVALVLSAIYTIANGTLTLADDVHHTQVRESRQQAFTTFCEQMLNRLPATTVISLETTQRDGQYLSRIEFDHAPSLFGGTSDCKVALFTEPMAGGGLRLLASCRKQTSATDEMRVVLFDEIAQCEWRGFDFVSRQWTNVWNQVARPGLIELSLTQANAPMRRTFWIAPNETVP